MTTNLRRFPDLPTKLSPNLEFVLGLSPSAMTLGLGNIRSLLERLGNPERQFRSIVVAGTNGKGSVTAMLASILAASGYKIGRYTSPHVYSVTERVCVDDVAVTVEDMEDAAARIVPLREEVPFSYFEALTAIAFLLFAKRGVQVAVLETGLGGRFDATNAVEPELSIITGISLDHRRILGDSEEEILREKLGVTRRGVPLFIGKLAAPLERIVREKSTRDSFPLVPVGEIGGMKTVHNRLGSTRVRVETHLADYGELTLPFSGAHQVTNALLAIGAAERIAGRLHGLAAGLRNAYLPGRFETVARGSKTFILDVAHNDEALTASITQLARTSPKADNALVFGLMKRKELFEFPRLIGASVGRVYLVPVGGADAYSPKELAQKYIGNGLKDGGPDVILWDQHSETDDHWLRLLDHLARPSTPCRRILIAGSHHVVEKFGKRLLTRGDRA